MCSHAGIISFHSGLGQMVIKQEAKEEKYIPNLLSLTL